jgi:hypothetical protein
MTGFGFNLSYLGGNEESYQIYQSILGKRIEAIRLDKEANGGDGGLWLQMVGLERPVLLVDDARSCCESRWMECDDNLPYFVGAEITEVETRSGADATEEYGDVKETLFVNIVTSAGPIELKAYNSHNGYYGGIMPKFRYAE